MFLGKRKGQSTAEYALTITLVLVVAGGIVSAAVKGALKNKLGQGIQYVNEEDGGGILPAYTSADLDVYDQRWSQTTVDGTTYQDDRVMQTGGGELKEQVQATTTTSVDVEVFDTLH